MNNKNPLLIESRDHDSEVLVQLSEWICKEPITNQYIEHPKSFWLLWNYLKRIGLKNVILKIQSRFSEKDRNKKIAGVFLGNIVEAPESLKTQIGKPVICFTPNQNENSSLIITNKNFVFEIAGNKQKKIYSILDLPSKLKKFIAWNKHSGKAIDIDCIRTEINNLASKLILKNNEVSFHSEYSDKIEKPPLNSKKPSGVLFGLGNYAKTSILPNIRSHINLQRVHEIDVQQLGYLKNKKNISIDTSPIPRPNSNFDVWFIAGFHHTHSKLAIEALKQNSYAVIEKPLVTNEKQYLEFSNQISLIKSPKFYSCFHKRYSELHEIFKRDNADNYEPVDMHCIVYEIPLPINHWYNWPTSGSRIISNGCHWLDYFMFINDYSKVVDIKKWVPRGNDISIQVKLENKAYLSLSLTDSGSQRLGVRDYIEIRSGDKTFKMIDGEYYQAEDRRHIFSRRRFNPLNAYSRMYSKISKKIANNELGDSVETLRSTKLMLDLEDI